MKKPHALSTKALGVSFWSILIIVAVVQWITNTAPLDGMGDIFAYLSIQLISMILLTINIALLARKLALKRSARVLWTIAGTFPLLLTVALSFLTNLVPSTRVAINAIMSTPPAGIEWLAMSFVLLVGYTVIYFAMIAKPVIKRTQPARGSVKIGLVGLLVIIAICIAHALAPSPADMAIHDYMQTQNPKLYTVKQMHYYHTCCDLTEHSNQQQANLATYVVEIRFDGDVPKNLYFTLGDNNQENNQFSVAGGHQAWVVNPSTKDYFDATEQHAQYHEQFER